MFMYTNVDCFFNKRSEILLLLDEKNPDIIALTEYLPKNRGEVTTAEMGIPGYTIFVNKSPRRGVAIYTKHKLNAKECDDLNNDEFHESVRCDFKDAHNDCLVRLYLSKS